MRHGPTRIARLAVFALTVAGCGRKASSGPGEGGASVISATASASASAAETALVPVPTASPRRPPPTPRLTRLGLDAEHAMFRSLPRVVAQGDLTRVQQVSGGLLFSPRGGVGDHVLVSGPRRARRFQSTVADGEAASMTEDGHGLVFVTSETSGGHYRVVSSAGATIWEGTTRPSPEITRDGLFLIGRGEKQMERVTFAKTADGYRVAQRRGYAGEPRRHLKNGIEITSALGVHDAGRDDALQTIAVTSPARPDGPLTRLSPRVPPLFGKRVCRSGRGTTLMLRTNNFELFWQHDGAGWGQGFRMPNEVFDHVLPDTVGCDDAGASFAIRRLGAVRLIRCRGGVCGALPVSPAVIPEAPGLRIDDGWAVAGIGDHLLAVQLASSLDGASGASIRYRFGLPGTFPRDARVLVSDETEGPGTIASIGLFGTANGAVLRVTNTAEPPGVSLVFFDSKGNPTVVEAP